MEGDEGEVGVRGGLKGKVRHGKVEYRSVVCMECAAGHIQRLFKCRAMSKEMSKPPSQHLLVMPSHPCAKLDQ